MTRKTLMNTAGAAGACMTIGAVVAASAKFYITAWAKWQAIAANTAAIERERASCKRDVEWLRADVEAALGKPLVRYYHGSDE